VLISLKQFNIWSNDWRLLGNSRLAEVSCSECSKEQWYFESYTYVYLNSGLQVLEVLFFGGGGVGGYRYFYQRKSEWKANRTSPLSWWGGKVFHFFETTEAAGRRFHIFHTCLFVSADCFDCWTKLMEFCGVGGGSYASVCDGGGEGLFWFAWGRGLLGLLLGAEAEEELRPCEVLSPASSSLLRMLFRSKSP
jgi:hypothetical protein